MAQQKVSPPVRKTAIRPASAQKLPYTTANYLIFGIGLFCIVIGYVFLSIGPWNSFWSLTLAPLFLSAGYLIAIPVALLYQSKTINSQN